MVNIFRLPTTYILFPVFFFSSSLLIAQDALDELAFTHIDHIEEFIDRFNFAEGSAFTNFAKSKYQDYNIDRPLVLQSLFNRRLNRTDQITQQKFINAVANVDRPVTLEIYDALWYATVPATVTIDKKKIDLKVSLEIQLNNDYSIEWTVIGLQSDALTENTDSKDLYISASSHATYFPELRTALASAEMFKTIISDSHKKNYTSKYMALIEKKNVSDVKIGTGIQYHFLQISGWIMVVEYAPQDNSLNTGWLISEVIEVDTFLEKRVYQWEKLGIFPPY